MRCVVLAGTTLLTAFVGLAVLTFGGGTAAGAQATANVAIGDNWFCNASFAGFTCDTSITAGDTVVWTNTGAADHTVTECGDAFSPCPLPGGFDSGVATPLTNGQTFSHTFPAAGTFEYYCFIHGNIMQGRIIVAAAQQTASPSPAPTPGQTGAGTAGTSPTATRTAGAVTVPGGGGTPSGGGPSWLPVLAMAGGLVLVTSASIGVLAFRRR